MRFFTLEILLRALHTRIRIRLIVRIIGLTETADEPWRRRMSPLVDHTFLTLRSFAIRKNCLYIRKDMEWVD